MGSGVAKGRECFFPTPEKMRGGRFVHCVIDVCLLIVISVVVWSSMVFFYCFLVRPKGIK